MDEQEAISQLQRGEIAGLQLLVEQHYLSAVRTAYLITRDRSLAEDVTQSSFVRVHEKATQFDLTRPFAPWLHRIVANEAIRTMERRGRDVSIDEDQGMRELEAVLQSHGAGLDPQEEAELGELKEAVWGALAKLSPRQRSAIVLRYYVGLKDREISDRMGNAPGTVHWLLHTARNRLRKILGPVLGRDDGGSILPETEESTHTTRQSSTKDMKEAKTDGN